MASYLLQVSLPVLLARALACKALATHVLLLQKGQESKWGQVHMLADRGCISV